MLATIQKGYTGLKFFSAQIKQMEVLEYSEKYKGFLVSEEGMPKEYRAIMQDQEIEFYLEKQSKYIECHKRHLEEERQEKEKQEQEEYKYNNTYGYIESIKLTPMAKGKILKTLNKSFNYYENGVFKNNSTRKDFIKAMLEEGYTLEHKTDLKYYTKKGELKIKNNEYRLTSPDNSFYEITKTEYDYAIYLKEVL